jgi:hypothetical protein
METKKNCKLQHQFRPVEEQANRERVALHIENVKNANVYDQYSFVKKAPEVLLGHDTSESQFAEVPYSIDRQFLQIRPGMIHNTVRENCKKEFDDFFKNAGSR